MAFSEIEDILARYDIPETRLEALRQAWERADPAAVEAEVGTHSTEQLLLLSRWLDQTLSALDHQDQAPRSQRASAILQEDASTETTPVAVHLAN